MRPGTAAEVKAKVRQQAYGSGAQAEWVVKGRSVEGREGTTVEGGEQLEEDWLRGWLAEEI